MAYKTLTFVIKTPKKFYTIQTRVFIPVPKVNIQEQKENKNKLKNKKLCLIIETKLINTKITVC